MPTLTGVLSLVGLASLGFSMGVFAILSARLGAVTKMPPRYRLFWIGLAGIVIAGAGRLLAIAGLIGADDGWLLLLLYYLPLALGLCSSLIAVFYYWRWLLHE